jgi:hypothetical protein
MNAPWYLSRATFLDGDLPITYTQQKQYKVLIYYSNGGLY